MELEAETAGIHDAQAQKTLADGLSAQRPFRGDSVADGNDEISDGRDASGKVFADHLQQQTDSADPQ